MMFENEVAWPAVRSPCCGICRCNEQDVCIGCGRTRMEIAQWMNMSDDEKRACKERCVSRLVKLRSDE